MKIINLLIIAVVALLSIAAGLAKVMQTEQEVEFLQNFGFSGTLIIVFGMVQIAGGLVLVPAKTRTLGAVIAASAFVVSSVLILVGGNTMFGLFSMIPIILACVIIYHSVKNTRRKSLSQDTGDTGTS